MDGIKPSQAKHLPDKGTDGNGIGDPVIQNASPDVAGKQLSHGARANGGSDPKKGIEKEIPGSNWWSRFIDKIKKLAGIIVFFAVIFGALLAWMTYKLSQNQEDRALANHFDVQSRLIIDSRGPRVQVSVTNKGENSAKQVSINAEEYWKQFPPPKTKPMQEAGNMQVQDDTPVDLVKDQTIYLEHKIDASRVRQMRNRKLTLHVAVELNWVDAKGQHCRDWFHFVQGGDYDPNAEVMGVDR